jgi:hypothetical protein
VCPRRTRERRKKPFSYCWLPEDYKRKTNQEEAEYNENGSCACVHCSHGVTSFSGITLKLAKAQAHFALPFRQKIE